MDTYSSIAKSIDHSVLGPSLTDRELEEACATGLQYQVASVCVIPHYLARLAELLRGSSVKASTTIGFPHGGHTTRTKLAETEGALDEGAFEVDVVVNIGKVMSDDFAYVERELGALTRLVHERGRIIKVIFETAYIDDARKKALCSIVGKVGADYAKTSTGFGPSGATLHDIELMRAHCPPAVAIKASGGIRDLDTLLLLRAGGATRIGTSRTSEILDEWRRRADTTRT
ncbi:MAG TPA: deoxyribose-phosphate aldolase [Polyangiaceae bacterium]|nr:deoxyribose-phosphate aldolase [Polyangiaceae bacterium]